MNSVSYYFGTLITALTLFSSSTLWAGVDSSGGGNAVVCFVSPQTRETVKADLEAAERSGINGRNPFARPEVLADIQQVESLDLYMHRLPRGRASRKSVELPQFPPQFNANEIVNALLQRLDTKASMGDEIREVQRYLPEEAWNAADGVVRIADNGLPILMPDTCLVAQIAYRRGMTIYYDQHLYDRLSEINKASLILHELLYALAKTSGATDAYPVYQAMSWIFLPEAEFAAIDPVEYARQLDHLFGGTKNLRAKRAFLYRDTEILTSVEVNRDGEVGQERVEKGVDVSLGDFKLHIGKGAPIEEMLLKDGKIRFARFNGTQYGDDLFLNFVFGVSLELSTAAIFDNGGDADLTAIMKDFAVDFGLSRLSFEGGVGFTLHHGKELVLHTTDSANRPDHIWVTYLTTSGRVRLHLNRLFLSKNGEKPVTGIVAEDLQLGFFRKLRRYSSIDFSEYGVIEQLR